MPGVPGVIDASCTPGTTNPTWCVMSTTDVNTCAQLTPGTTNTRCIKHTRNTRHTLPGTLGTNVQVLGVPGVRGVHTY